MDLGRKVFCSGVGWAWVKGVDFDEDIE